LIAYFIANISANEYYNLFTCVKVIASHRWDDFSETWICFCGSAVNWTRCTLCLHDYHHRNSYQHGLGSVPVRSDK